MCPASADYRIQTVRTLGQGPRPRQTNSRPEAMRFCPSAQCPPRSSKRRNNPRPCNYRHRKGQKKCGDTRPNARTIKLIFPTKMGSHFRQKLTAFPLSFLVVFFDKTDHSVFVFFFYAGGEQTGTIAGHDQKYPGQRTNMGNAISLPGHRTSPPRTPHTEMRLNFCDHKGDPCAKPQLRATSSYCKTVMGETSRQKLTAFPRSFLPLSFFFDLTD